MEKYARTQDDIKVEKNFHHAVSLDQNWGKSANKSTGTHRIKKNNRSSFKKFNFLTLDNPDNVSQRCQVYCPSVDRDWGSVDF